MEGYPIPAWGWVLTIGMIVVWIALAAGLVNLFLMLTKGLWHGGKKPPED